MKGPVGAETLPPESRSTTCPANKRRLSPPSPKPSLSLSCLIASAPPPNPRPRSRIPRCATPAIRSSSSSPPTLQVQPPSLPCPPSLFLRWVPCLASLRRRTDLYLRAFSRDSADLARSTAGSAPVRPNGLGFRRWF
jgi:hypothetical protein